MPSASFCSASAARAHCSSRRARRAWPGRRRSPHLAPLAPLLGERRLRAARRLRRSRGVYADALLAVSPISFSSLPRPLRVVAALLLGSAAALLEARDDGGGVIDAPHLRAVRRPRLRQLAHQALDLVLASRRLLLYRSAAARPAYHVDSGGLRALAVAITSLIGFGVARAAIRPPPPDAAPPTAVRRRELHLQLSAAALPRAGRPAARSCCSALMVPSMVCCICVRRSRADAGRARLRHKRGRISIESVSAVWAHPPGRTQPLPPVPAPEERKCMQAKHVRL